MCGSMEDHIDIRKDQTQTLDIFYISNDGVNFNAG